MIHFSGCALNEACTIVLRGASEPACPPGHRADCCEPFLLAALVVAGRLQPGKPLGAALGPQPPLSACACIQRPFTYLQSGL